MAALAVLREEVPGKRSDAKFTLVVPANTSLVSWSEILQGRSRQGDFSVGWKGLPGEELPAVGEFGILTGVGPDSRYYDSLVSRYGFQPEDGVELPADGAIFSFPPTGKIGMYLKHFEAGYRLPTSDFFMEVLDHYHVHIHQLVRNGVNKIIAFELLSRAVHLEPDLYVFRHFFRFTRASTGNNYTFCVRQDRPTLVTDQKGTARNWSQHFIWVNEHRVGVMKHRVDPITDRAFTLFPAKETIAKVL
ncbi:hypothetical protein L2E82_39060 [Cichorium intybus]|uniref:Uncharacterized protein n=1 Tax=Cichorium intybus TaxID=13427 RepID=A0ACB9ALJ0_CICIN|nr:hypothetical protein L2E82_39060 [Cichorium intybus]